MRIDNLGNVGIGVVAPGLPLEINGDARIFTTTDRFPDFHVVTTFLDSEAGIKLTNDAQTWQLKTNSNDDFVILDVGDGNANRLQIVDGGTMGINNTVLDRDTVIHGTSANLLYINAGTNTVGIGTATQQGQLHVGANNVDTDFLSGTSDVIFDGGVNGRSYFQGSSDAFIFMIDSGSPGAAVLMPTLPDESIVKRVLVSRSVVPILNLSPSESSTPIANMVAISS